MKNLVLFLLLTLLVGCGAKPQQLGQAIADVKKEAGAVVCYYFDSDEDLDHYWKSANKHYTYIPNKDGHYVFRDLNIAFTLPQTYSYYVFQDNSAYSNDLKGVKIIPFNDIGCIGDGLHNGVIVSTEAVAITNPKVIKEEVTFGSNTFQKITVPLAEHNPYILYKIEHDGLYYTFGTSRNQYDKDLMEQLVTSLEFLEFN